MTAKLQLTLDTPKVDECMELVGQVQDYVDIVEVGNPVLIEAGLALVRMIKEAYPRLTVVADAKIYHGGHYIAARCFDMGADVVTVLGVTSDQVISGAVNSALSRGKYISADLAGISRPYVRAQELEELGVKYMVVPSALPNEEGRDDMGDSTQGLGTRIRRAALGKPLARAKEVKRVLKHSELAVVGNITEGNVDQVSETGADIVLVGRAIIEAENPAEAARELREKLTA